MACTRRSLRWAALRSIRPWHRNLVEHPLVELQDEASKGDYTARELSGDERTLWWQRAVEVWPDYANYQTKTDRVIRVFVLEPVG
jgi:F420H(2)-dependent quinone reductase